MRPENSLRCAAKALVAIASVAFAAAQAPQIAGANLQQRSAAGGLESTFRSIVASQATAAWIGYAVPMLAGDHEVCCSDSWNDGNSGSYCGECRLEAGEGMNMNSSPHQADLEGSQALLVFFRVENHAVEKVRVFSEDCQVNAGGRTVYWLTSVPAAESVAMLASLVAGSGSGLVNADDRDHVSDGAVLAIALHADPSAERALDGFVAPGQPEKLRERSAFWLGSARGRSGFETLHRLAREDRDDSFREKLMFDLSISKQPAAVDALIESARNDSSSKVRGQALFWLSQKAGKKAASAITEAIEKDPETEVKKRAVFALSQLPKDQGVPLLIQTARTNSNPAVRKQAMFWLGQSNDPRALDFFEQVLGQKN
ncbi:MAG TPA: HEAT repeat domain-containing protein [Terriglobia bacterium]|nr:HEAT repeat domain-containing protein [Terriglobia bacterium]